MNSLKNMHKWNLDFEVSKNCTKLLSGQTETLQRTALDPPIPQERNGRDKSGA